MGALVRWLQALEPFVSTLALCLAGAAAGSLLPAEDPALPAAWAPGAIAIGLILRRPDRPGSAILAGALAACVVASFHLGLPAEAAFGLASATLVQIALAVTLLGRAHDTTRLETIDDLCRILTALVVAVSASTLVAASVLGPASGLKAFVAAQRWWTASIVPTILAVPMLLTARADAWRDADTSAAGRGFARRAIELVALVATVLFIALTSRGVDETAIVAFMAAPLIWIGLRFGIGPTAAASAALGTLVMGGTAAGWWREEGLATASAAERLALAGLAVTTISVAAFVVALTLRQLRESRALLAATVAAIPDPVLVYDRDQRLMLCNDAVRSAFPQLGDLLVPGTRARELYRRGRHRGLTRHIRAVTSVSAAEGDVEMELVDGRVMQARVRPVMGLGRLVIARDVSDWAERARRATWLAEHDALTGLPNRRAFDARLRAMLREGDRHRHVVLVLLDLDDFKPINDRHGHPVGDAVLREVASRLNTLIGPSGHAARIGGDEFALLLRLRHPEAELRRLLERARGALSAPMHINGMSLHIGASLGHALLWRDGSSAEELMGRADLALYADKRARAQAGSDLGRAVA